MLKYSQRYSVDTRALSEIAAAGSGIKGQNDPFQMAGSLELGQNTANQANDLLAQAEAAARSGDFGAADRLFAQAQGIIGGISSHAQSAFNLGGGEDSAAAIRASSTEGRIVGRQLLTAQQLGDPNSQTSADLRGRLLDPGLAAVDENARLAERAIAAERSQIDGEIRQRGTGGGSGVSGTRQLALQAQTASQAAFQRAQVYSVAGAQKAQMISQVNLYLNEFGKRMAEDSVALAQEWVNGSANVRDIYQESLQRLDLFQAEMSNQWAKIFFNLSEARRAESKAAKAARRDEIIGFNTGTAVLGTVFAGGKGVGNSAQPVQGGTNVSGVGAGEDVAFGAVAGPNGAQSTTPQGGGGGGFLGAVGTIFSFL